MDGEKKENFNNSKDGVSIEVPLGDLQTAEAVACLHPMPLILHLLVACKTWHGKRRDVRSTEEKSRMSGMRRHTWKKEQKAMEATSTSKACVSSTVTSHRTCGAGMDTLLGQR